MTAEHRSAHPNLPGLPWWAAIAVAVLTTAVGVAFDAGSGDNELTHVFAALYVLGCFGAVLAVRQSGLFTAVIQPPLILFCAVPAAYWMFHGATITDIKGILINCGYPLIERFPLMLFTSAGVLLVGMVRWYFGMTTRPSTPDAGAETPREAKAGPGVVATSAASVKRLVATLTAALQREPARPRAVAGRQRGADRPRRPSRTATASRGAGSTRHAAPARSRHERSSRPGQPGPDDAPYREADRRRQRQRESTRGEAPPPPRRRPRPPQNGSRHGQPAREVRRDLYRDVDRPGRPAAGGDRMDPYRPVGRSGSPPPQPPQPPPPRRRAPNAVNGADTTHHPISQVRYRRPDAGKYDR